MFGTIMANKIGKKIKDLRKEKKWTLDKLAEKTGSSKSYIWELENKETTTRPSADKLSKIAKELDVTLDYLLDENDSISSDQATDEAFYRKYQTMDDPTKDKIRKMLDLFNNE